MIIESIKINAFGCLRDRTYELGAGMNIIEGENESGKSTLAAFIRYMLYGFPGRASSTELVEKKKRISWQEGSASGSMTVRVGEKRYRIERSTVASTGAHDRETYRETSSIIDVETGTAVFPGVAAGELFLGVPEEVFVNTAFVGQVGSPRVGDGVAESIENLLFSGDENLSAQRAMDKLDALRRSLLYKNGKGGELFDLSRREEELAERLAVAQEKNAAVLAGEAELEDISHRLDEVARELAAVTAEERRARNIILAEAFARLHEAEDTLREAQEALADMEGMPAYLLEDSDLGELRARRTAATEAAERARAATVAREQLESTAPIGEEERELLDRAEREGGPDSLRARAALARRSVFGGGALALFGLLLALFGGAFAAVRPDFLATSLVYAFVAGWVIAGLLVLFGGLMAVPAFLRLRRIHTAYRAANAAEFARRLESILSSREALATYRADVTAARATEAAASADYNRSLAELDTVVHRFGSRLPEEDVFPFLDTLLTDAARVLMRKKDYEATRVSSSGIIAQLRLHLGDANEEDVLATLPPENERPRASEVHPEELRGRMEFYRNQERELENRRRETERAVDAERARAEDPAELSEELFAVRREIASVREQYEACVLAHDAIEGAGERLRRDISPRLGSFTGRMMDCLTDGRYTTVGVAADLAVALDTGDATRSVDYLSAGTQDLTYLSLRMALIDLLYRKEKPPVCFDESFAHQDDTRASRMIQLLLLLAEEGGQQNFVFTCHGREYRLAQEIAAGKSEVTRIRLEV